MAFNALVKIVVAWACCDVVNVSSEVRRDTWLATTVAGSGGVEDVSVPNRCCARSVAAKTAARIRILRPERVRSETSVQEHSPRG